ncbi:LacI family DNA-binding transcriptional regulator [Pantoea sp. MBD-2R]|uniref:LacI family DNA-binding transcriptional regulator n=1 Tax=Pantoea sp. MBD-2R TaxID=3141540 RepID=UPI003183BF3F
MASHPTMNDVAREAGVGVATVDRVINRRAPVKPATQQRVMDAARRLGFSAGKGMTSSAVPCRLGFILLDSGAEFYRQFSEQLRFHAERSAHIAANPHFVWLSINASQQIADAIVELAGRVDVIGIVATDNPVVNQAINHVQEKGVRVYTLFSELTASGCAGYMGLDNRKAGRTAAWMISRLCKRPGKIGILLGDHRFLCQEMAEIGFRSWFREKAAEFDILEPLRSYEDDGMAEQATRTMLEENSDLVALYVPSGGVDGVVRALLAAKKQQSRTLTVVCHGPIAHAQKALLEEVVDVFIWHRMPALAAEIIAAIADDFVHEARGNQQRYLPFDILTVENF